MDKPFIIMLDLDGPVCTHRANNGLGDFFDPVAGGMLAKLCAQTGARIVIISARRRDGNLLDKLAQIGILPWLYNHPDHWRTGHDPDGIRGNEVDAWHADCPGHSYAIVDDERGGYAPHHIKRLVHTDLHAGLSLRDLWRLKRLMGMDGLTQKDIDDVGAQKPRITLAQMARDALAAMDQGDDDGARRLLDLIADHPLAQ